MKYLISFANETYKKSQKILEVSAYAHGIDNVINFSPESFEGTEFYAQNQEILSLPRGCGYWLWKPYIILDTMTKMNGDDYLVYCDSGVEIIDDLAPLFNLCDQKKHIILFSNSPQHKNKKWTKKDTFKLMEATAKKFINGQQLTATFIVLKKNDFNEKFVKEWFEYCKDARILTDIPSKGQEFEEFSDHRHDQSILSIMAIKYNLETFRDPSQWGNSRKIFWYRKKGEISDRKKYDIRHISWNSPYNQLFNHHRGKLNMLMQSNIGVNNG